MNIAKKYSIAYKGLKNGLHEFDFKVDGGLFAAEENTEIKGGECDVHVSLEKSESMLEIGVAINGYVITECDRCLEDLKLPVETSFEESYALEGVELDLSQDVYDFICTSLPLKRVHPEGECNQETVGYLSE